VLDEPVNGLDPQGILWIRNLLRGLAAEGRTVFVSSHLMSEMALTAEHLIVIGRGRVIADTSVQEFIDRASRKIVRVRTQQATELRDLLAGPDIGVTSVERGLLEVAGLSGTEIGQVACRNAIALEELTPIQASLEEAFMELTDEAVEYRTDTAAQEREAS
jgi:ABC-2 type transport system ATP-binding protein